MNKPNDQCRNNYPHLLSKTYAHAHSCYRQYYSEKEVASMKFAKDVTEF